MSYYRVCPACGCHLDPGEVCDCRGRTEVEQRTNKEKAAQGISSTRGGRVEQVLTDTVSTSSLSNNVEENQV